MTAVIEYRQPGLKPFEEQLLESQKETKVMVSIVHPNFVKVCGWEVQQKPKKRVGIAREWLEGPNLDMVTKLRIKAGRRFTEPECLKYFVQIALVLKEFHDMGETHKRIWSENILISNWSLTKHHPNEQIKVMTTGNGEFRIDRRSRQAAFLSPMVQQGFDYTMEEDIWSLGVILLFLATGKTPQDVKSEPSYVVENTGRYLEQNFSKQFNELLFDFFHLIPKDRPSINQVLLVPIVRRTMLAYIETEQFQRLYKEEQMNQLVVSDDYKLFRAVKHLEHCESNYTRYKYKFLLKARKPPEPVNQDFAQFFQIHGKRDAMWINSYFNLDVMTWFRASRLSAEGLGIQSVLVTPRILEYVPIESKPPPKPRHCYRLLKLPKPQEVIYRPKQPRLRPYTPPTLCLRGPKPSLQPVMIGVPEQMTEPKKMQSMYSKEGPGPSSMPTTDMPMPYTYCKLEDDFQSWDTKQITVVRCLKNSLQRPPRIKEIILISKHANRLKPDNAFFKVEHYTYKDLKKQFYNKIHTSNAKVQLLQCTSDNAFTRVEFYPLTNPSDPEEVEKAYHQATMAFNLPHPNIIRVRDAFMRQDLSGKTHVCTAFEQTESSLEELIKEESPLSESVCLYYFSQIILAFQEVHESSMIHGNVQASSILIRNTPKNGKIAKLSDFEVMQEVNAQQEPSYGKQTKLPAPEVGVLYMQESDVWAIGCILLHMAQGRAPLQKDEVEDLDPQLFSLEFRELIIKLMQHNPKERITIEKIIQLPLIKPHMFDWVTSRLFQVQYKESKQNMIKFINDIKSEKYLRKATVSLQVIDQQYQEYVLKICGEATTERPSKQPYIFKEQLFQQYDKIQALDQDDEGNMVFKVKSNNDDKIYLMKEISLQGLPAAERKKALKEVSIFKGIKHLHIQGVQESFFADGNLCIVYEFCDSGTLNKELRERYELKQYFSEDELMSWFSHICHGLKYMHDMGIAHRQIDSRAVLLHLVCEDTEGVCLKIGAFAKAINVDQRTVSKKKQSYDEKYEQLEELGRGGYGEVYRVQNRETKQYFAAKHVNMNTRNSENHFKKMVEMTQREDKIMKNLKHQNIVGHVESFIKEQECLAIIIMELCESGTLSKHLQAIKKTGIQVDEEQILIVLYQCCNALKLAEQWNLVHSDIKPDNIVICSKGLLKLTDFGVSNFCQTGEDGRKEEAGGTAAYRSPENSQNFVTHKCDIWSLGCVIHEICTLTKTWPQNSFCLQYAIQNSEPTKLPAQYSENLQNLVKQMLAKDPEKRPYAYEIIAKPFIQNVIQKKFGILAEHIAEHKVDVYVDPILNESDPFDRGESIWSDWDGESMARKFSKVGQKPPTFTVPSNYWDSQQSCTKSDDVKQLAVLLHEMATLSASLSLIHHIDSDVERPPIPVKYSEAFRRFLAWLDQEETPTMFQVINEPYFYRFYYSVGVKLARASRNKQLKDCQELLDKVKLQEEKQVLPKSIKFHAIGSLISKMKNLKQQAKVTPTKDLIQKSIKQKLQNSQNKEKINWKPLITRTQQTSPDRISKTEKIFKFDQGKHLGSPLKLQTIDTEALVLFTSPDKKIHLRTQQSSFKASPVKIRHIQASMLTNSRTISRSKNFQTPVAKVTQELPIFESLNSGKTTMRRPASTLKPLRTSIENEKILKTEIISYHPLSNRNLQQKFLQFSQVASQTSSPTKTRHLPQYSTYNSPKCLIKLPDTIDYPIQRKIPGQRYPEQQFATTVNRTPMPSKKRKLLDFSPGSHRYDARRVISVYRNPVISMSNK